MMNYRMEGMKGGSFAGFLKRALVTGLGVVMGSFMLSGIDYDTNGTLLLVAILLGFFSSALKPLLVVMALPFVVMTMGLGLLIINALLYMLVGSMVEGFYVEGFWAAFFGALIISFLNVLFGAWINGLKSKVRVNVGGIGAPPRRAAKPQRIPKAKDDVIDI